MNKETIQPQLLLAFILGGTIFLLSWWKAFEINEPEPLIMAEQPILTWENGKLLFNAEGRGDVASVYASDPPALLRPIFFYPIPINKAPEELLITISGIGPVLARRIIAFREEVGHIQDHADLLAVKGIGEKRAAMIAEQVSFDR